MAHRGAAQCLLRNGTNLLVDTGNFRRLAAVAGPNTAMVARERHCSPGVHLVISSWEVVLMGDIDTLERTSARTPVVYHRDAAGLVHACHRILAGPGKYLVW